MPGRPMVRRLPRGPMLIIAPGTPALTLTPLRLKFTLRRERDERNAET
ncbi:hypothetical protein AB4Z10_19625 [Bosea sp. RAF48]